LLRCGDVLANRAVIERWVLSQHHVVEATHFGRWIDPELLEKGVPGSVKGAQGVALPSRSVQGEDQLAPQPLPERVLRRQALE
jgi:hypothetical protein